MKFIAYKYLFFIFVVIPIFLMFAKDAAAVCGTDCGWTGTGSGSSCVAYETSSACNYTPGIGCGCTSVMGCVTNPVGQPWPASCVPQGGHVGPYLSPDICCGISSTPPPTSGGGGGGGNTCSGSCLTPGPGDNNCGDINGSQSRPGSCGAGELCCGFGGGGPSSGCNITTNGPFSVTVGQRAAVTINANGTGGGTFGAASFIAQGPGTGRIIIPGGWSSVNPPRPYVGRIEGTAVGTWNLRVDVENGTGCSKVFLVNVLPSTTPPPAPAPTVSITANGAANVTIPSGTAATLAWTSTNATTCSASGDWNGTKAVPSGSQSTGNVTTTNSYTITCTGPGGTASDTAQVNVTNVALEPGWWQAENGHVVTQGNIISKISDASKMLVQDGVGAYPGVVVRSITGSIDTGSGPVSSTLWSARSIINGVIPDYSSFENLIPISIVPSDPGNSVNQNELNTGGAALDGYAWYRREGDLNISGNINLNPGRKIILYVNGNVTISGTINYSPTNSMLVIISSGDISVSPSVTSPINTYTLTGIFYSDGRFLTGNSASRLSVLGSVVAMDGVSLERDLGSGNTTEPAEKFTLSADLVANYPSALTFKHPSWSEVAP